MHQQQFIKRIQDRLLNENKRLEFTPDTLAKHHDECRAFEKDFISLCEMHNMSGQVFAVNKSAPAAMKTVFCQTSSNKLDTTELAMCLSYWFEKMPFGKSVGAACSIIADMRRAHDAQKEIDINLPLATEERPALQGAA